MKSWFRYFIAFIIAFSNWGFGWGINLSDYSFDTLPNKDKGTSVTLKFIDNFSNQSRPNRIKQSLLLRNQRLSPHAGSIRTVAKNVPEEVMNCITYAKSIWENVLISQPTLLVEVEYSLIDNDMETAVIYDKDEAGVYIPYSMKRNLDQGSIVGKITINSNIDWDYAMADNVNDNKKNLTFALLRSFCRILGFGSSIVYNSDAQQYKFFNRQGYTPFDYLVESSDGISLTDIPLKGGRNNPELTAYLNQEGRSFTVGKDSVKYKLVNNTLPALCFLEDGLMSADVSVGDHYLKVDDNALDVLRMIGWEVESANLFKIICIDSKGNEIPDSTGIFTANESHSFQVVPARRPIAGIPNLKWKFLVPLKNGDMKEVDVRSGASACTIQRADLNTDYEYDVDGLVKCRLEVEGTFGNVQVKAQPYTVYWSFGPRINKVRVTEINYSEDRRFYKAKFEVDCEGAEVMQFFTTEEYNPIISIHKIREYKTYKGETGYMYAKGYAWLNFRFEQDGKEVEYKVEIAPDTQDWYPVDPGTMLAPKNTGIAEILSGTECLDGSIKIFDVNGNPVFDGNCNGNVGSIELNPGVYIIVSINKETTRTYKYIKR